MDQPTNQLLDQLAQVAETSRAKLEAKHQAREALLAHSRSLTRHCANTIRAIHRQEWEPALAGLDQARAVMEAIKTASQPHPDLYYAGYTQDALKEFVEASVTYALVHAQVIPSADALGIETATYLNGLCEAASELRRYILDIIRHEHVEQAEFLLESMEAVYALMVTMDFTDAISGGLRHRTDALRGVLERTRGDVTLSLRQQRLEAALKRAEDALK